MGDNIDTGSLDDISGNIRKIVIDIESDATIGYASIQNAVPVVRSLRLTNHHSDAIEDLQVLVTCNPAFAQGIKLRFDRLGPGETRGLSPVDLHPDHTFLSHLQESVNASIKVSVLAGIHELACVIQPIQILAYDQWAGTRALPELLAAFCMPNNPVIDKLIGRASQLLRTGDSALSLNGYQSQSQAMVWKQISAIYSTIAAENLQYAEPPASFTLDGQKIRTPERIWEGRVATCLDLAMLFASCLEQAGLRPVVLLQEGHAWVGVWLHATAFPDPLTDDVQAIRKRIDSGEFLAFETTGVAQHPHHRPSLRIATEQGHAYLQEDTTFRYAIDIHRARELQIKPLPSRDPAFKRAGPETCEQPTAIEPVPYLPPLDVESLAPLELRVEDTPEGRLAQWKSRLLDLTLRNRLLNFKTTKTTLSLVAPDLTQLEATLSEGGEFRIRPVPELMEGPDPRVARVHTSRGGHTPIDDMARESLRNKELLAHLSADAVDGCLLAIHNAARIGLEESGANTLYLALGLLQWTETEKAGAIHKAPILLIPVTLQRQSVRNGFRLSRHDDDAIINPTLLQLLRTQFALKLPDLDFAPVESKGLDISKILQIFRLKVREIPQWEVLEQAHLGIFSFTKYLMWKDLQDRTEHLKNNRVVRHLIDHPGEAFATEAHDEALDRLDERYGPQDILAPLLSDSSQFQAICAVDRGQDLVLEGPPGTGKSQTIANLIAHTLAKGKTVLFVSEKMAALAVVHRRLSAIGLGPFCLELHSAKAKKTEVLQQLEHALGIGSQRTAADWAREAERLAHLRQDLNSLSDSLHKEHANGLTVFTAMGTCIEHSGETPSAMPWPDASTHDRVALDGLRETVRQMAAHTGLLGNLPEHALSALGQTEWSPSWQDTLLTETAALDRAIHHLREQFIPVAQLLPLAVSGYGLETYTALDQLADTLLTAPTIPMSVVHQAYDPRTPITLHTLAQHGLARSTHWQLLDPRWTPELAQVNAVALQTKWQEASALWGPRSWFAKRTITTRLRAFRTDHQRPPAEELPDLFPTLARVNTEDHALHALQADAKSLLQEAYSDLQTDWTALTQYAAWAQALTDALTRIAGPDAVLKHALQTAVTALLTKDRATLLPAGPVGQALLGYRQAWHNVRQRLDSIEHLARPTRPLAGPQGTPGALERIQDTLAGWSRTVPLIQPWCLWQNMRDKALTIGLQGLIESLESGVVHPNALASHFEYSYQQWWVKKTIDYDPILRRFSSADHERKIREFRETDTRFQKLTEQYIAATLAGRIPTAANVVVGADSELGRLRREIQKQRRHIPVRQLINALPTLLSKLKPCLLMSPLSVAQYLDAGYAPFDLVVFDEASQICVWDAVGAIARGKQLVVVGDPKQLPPTNFFHKSADTEGETTTDEVIEDLESILDECLGAGMNRLSLRWHYRSRHESLIAFSNVHYYDSQLITFPSPVTTDNAVQFKQVHGIYDRGGSRTNRAEAEAIISGIEAHYLAGNGQRTLGIVTLNQPQQALIETLLDTRRRAHPPLDRTLSAITHEPLFIKNLENVQGDERDVIFFSITHGPDAAGKQSMNFGPLNSEGGHRRLNVAISRAREAVVIYSTLMPDQIRLAQIRSRGVRDLRNYLEFARSGTRALLAQSLPTGLEPDSPLETGIIKALCDRGWTVHPQVGCSGYRIDIGVVDPRAPGRYLAGIECDGRTYHSGATARDRDRLRQYILEGLGWTIYRIWSSDWWRDPGGEIETITARLQALLEIDSEAPLDVPETNDTPNIEAFDAGITPQGGAELFAHAPPDSAESPLETRIYRPAILSRCDSAEFYEDRAAREIQEQLRWVVASEGPLSEAVLFRRVARAWGLERTGSRIVERLQALIPRTTFSTQERDTIFYWPTAPSDSWSAFRVADRTEGSRRHIDDVCKEEISALIQHVLDQVGASTRQDVARALCKLLGMARTPAEAQARAIDIMDSLIVSGTIVASGEYLRLR